jgi:hypothetical protein
VLCIARFGKSLLEEERASKAAVSAAAVAAIVLVTAATVTARAAVPTLTRVDSTVVKVGVVDNKAQFKVEAE